MGVDRSGGRYIAVEGPIGVGKTALARRLATELGVPLILEQGEDNPFLRRFYEDRGKYAFQAQLFFLLERYRQQRELARHGTCSGGAVADYLFAKDRIFAAVNLNADELALYEQLARLTEAFRNFFYGYTVAPLLVVNCSDIDFVEHGGDLADLIREIQGMRQGVQHYIPLGSR